MRNKNKIFRLAMRPAIIVTCLAVCAALTIGITLSRYETTIKESINFRSEELSRLEIVSENGWVTGTDELTIDFSVKNLEQNSDGVQFVLYLASSPISEAETLSVTLTVGEAEYTAACEEIMPDSSLYRAFGVGYVYRFYSGEDKIPQAFDIDKGEETEGILTSEQMRLTISGKTGVMDMDSVGLIKLYAVLV